MSALSDKSGIEGYFFRSGLQRLPVQAVAAGKITVIHVFDLEPPEGFSGLDIDEGDHADFDHSAPVPGGAMHCPNDTAPHTGYR